MVFRGHLRSIGHPQGMMSYLWTNQVYLKNFGDHVEKVTQRVKEVARTPVLIKLTTKVTSGTAGDATPEAISRS